MSTMIQRLDGRGSSHFDVFVMLFGGRILVRARRPCQPFELRRKEMAAECEASVINSTTTRPTTINTTLGGGDIKPPSIDQREP